MKKWIALAADDRHWIPEFLHFPAAWHGAIDHTAPALAQSAFTFWELDVFLARYGFTAFREIADALERV